jgi:hypothetical protein
MVKRTEVIRRLRQAAGAKGVGFGVVELTNHTGIIVDGFRSTLGRHREVDEITARKFFKQ